MGTALHRATVGFFVAPLTAAALLAITEGNGEVAGFSLMILYPVTLILVLPLFLVFRRLRWLRWWHACTVGGIVALLVAPGVDFRISKIDAEEVRDALAYLSVGTGAAFVFWCIAVFREPAYDYIPRRLPIAPLAMIVLLVPAAVYLRLVLEPNITQGQIMALLPADHGQPRSEVKLDTGVTAQAGMLCYISYAAGNRVTILHRPRSRFIPERYTVTDKVREGKFDPDAYLAEAQKCVDEAQTR